MWARVEEVGISCLHRLLHRVGAVCNTINTIDGGTHLTGLRSALTRVINDYARKSGLLKDADPNFSGDDTREGLTGIVSIKHREPQFESQTKVKLMNPEVQTYVQQVLVEAFGEFLEENPRRPRPSSRSVSPRPAPAMPPRRPATWSSARAPWRALRSPASWPTAPSATPQVRLIVKVTAPAAPNRLRHFQALPLRA
jgi:DNA gyrase subunit B